MAQRRALVIESGRVQELPSADSLQGVAQWSFGTGNPSDSAGAQGDYYVGSDNKLWSKGATTWTYTGVQYGSSAAVPEKTVPVDADILSLGDSANGLQMRKLTWANMRAALPFREKLSAARTYYVRTDGSDSNTGLANTAAGAFRTIQKAVDVAAALDNGNFDITVVVQAGTWTAGAELKETIGGGTVVIDGGSMASCTVSTNGANCFAAVRSTRNSKYRLQNMRLQTASSGYAIAAFGGPTNIEYQAIDFGPTPGAQIFVSRNSNVTAVGAYTISGNALAHVIASEFGAFTADSAAVTLAGTPAFTTAFVAAVRIGFASFNTTSFSGTATGPRYLTNNGGGVFVAGAGASYLPGSAAGTVASPGWYA